MNLEEGVRRTVEAYIAAKKAAAEAKKTVKSMSADELPQRPLPLWVKIVIVASMLPVADMPWLIAGNPEGDLAHTHSCGLYPAWVLLAASVPGRHGAQPRTNLDSHFHNHSHAWRHGCAVLPTAMTHELYRCAYRRRTTEALSALYRAASGAPLSAVYARQRPGATAGHAGAHDSSGRILELGAFTDIRRSPWLPPCRRAARWIPWKSTATMPMSLRPPLPPASAEAT